MVKAAFVKLGLAQKGFLPLQQRLKAITVSAETRRF